MQIEPLKFPIDYKKTKRQIKRFTRRYKRKDLFLIEDLIPIEDLSFKDAYFLKKEEI